MNSIQKQNRKISQSQGAELSGLVTLFGRNNEAGIAELRKMEQVVKTINLTKGAITADKRAGFIFEEIVAGTYNASARKAGDFKTTATTGSCGGFGTDPRVDIRVVKNGKMIVEAQAKCCGTPARTAVSIGKAKYAGTERIVPKEQVQLVKQKLEDSAKGKATSTNQRMREIGEARAEASGKVNSRLEAGGHKSRAVSHKDAIKIAKGDTSRISRMIAVERVTNAATSGAKSGAVFSGGMSAVTTSYQLATGKISGREAIKIVATETVVGGVRSAATSVVAEGVKSAATLTLSKAASRAILRGAGPLAVAGCVVDVVSDACKGELTTEKAARSVTRAAGGWAGAEGGAMLGTAICPGVGTLIGGLVGGMFGSMLGGAW